MKLTLAADSPEENVDSGLAENPVSSAVSRFVASNQEAAKVPWELYGRCVFSLCGSLIHNAGAWNLVDLFVM
jgi:hypothetical protein